jgi:outer membrane protein assembly factor BamB
VANNVLYGAGGGAIAAFNPTTGSAAWIAATGGTHWQSPVVVSGQVIATDNSGHLTVYQRP